MRGDSSSMNSFSTTMDSEHGYHDEDDLQDNHDDHLHFGNNNCSSKADIRKSNKPIMEKKRRARINNCLNELKGILLEAMRKDPARHSKLEKADILELSVRHLQNIQRNQLAVAMATDPTVLYRFKNGFSECASEVSRYLSKLDGVDSGMKQRVSSHLSSCVNGLQQVNPVVGYPTLGASRYPSSTDLHLPFAPSQLFSPTAPSTIIPPSNLTPPGDVNNNSGGGIIPLDNMSSPLQVQQRHHHRSTGGVSAFTLVGKCPSSSSPSDGPVIESRVRCPPIIPVISSEEANPVDYSLSSSKGKSTELGGGHPGHQSQPPPPRHIRVVKVEPTMHNISSLTPEGSSTGTKDSMWRPW